MLFRFDRVLQQHEACTKHHGHKGQEAVLPGSGVLCIVAEAVASTTAFRYVPINACE